jgi:putative ABC transport system permease protein
MDPLNRMTQAAVPRLSAFRLLIQAVLIGHLRVNPGRVLLAVLGIALGVALALAVALIHRAAVDDFDQAARRLSGEADLVVRGDGTGFPEALYVRLARHPRVEQASPGVEFNLSLKGRREFLRLLGIDPFRAAAMGQPAEVSPDDRYRVLDADAVILSEPAARWLGLEPGDVLTARAGGRTVSLRVIAILPDVPTRLAVMDIAGAQWLFGEIGRIDRVDLRLVRGVDPAGFARELRAGLPPGVRAESPSASGGRIAEVSRAYRVNIGVLSTIGLFTGIFLVFTTQWLSILRRRGQLALLRTLGVTPNGLAGLLVLEAAVIGAAGSAIGLVLGVFLAGVGLELLGGDLGAGYFWGLRPDLRPGIVELAGFFLLGVTASIVGSLPSAREVARTAPAQALRAGDVERALLGWRRAWPGLLLIAAGALAAFLPPLAGLPLGGYAAIGAMILGVILLLPRLLAAVAAWLPLSETPGLRLALLQVRGAPGQAAVSVAAVVASVALAVAMAVMVHSFRESMDAWLHRLLRADLYVRAGAAGGTGFLDEAAQRELMRLPGVTKAEFVRFREVTILPDRPSLSLIARPLDPEASEDLLPLLQRLHAGASSLPPIWISEAVQDIYGWRPGDTPSLPLGGTSRRFVVAGVWRDYARQHGAIALNLDTYRQMTGDVRANDAWLWLEKNAAPAQVVDEVKRRIPGGEAFEFRDDADVRRMSLDLFDRTFAVTYALEAVAIIIGLAGVSAGFSAQALARRREFGMLRHLGMTPREIGAMLAAEAGLMTATGLAAGWVAGLAAGFVLVHVVNPQSFHWRMTLTVPWESLALFSAAVLGLAVAAAVASARVATGPEALRAVREE